ncbi:MAG TPA: hypothetical protein P5191_10695 [Ruminococcus sp.]|nr:hypothetical protein [Ruminococcus sp.]
MRFIKTICMVFAADILALFISLTLAGSSALAVKIVSAVCGIGILAVILADYAAVTAKKDRKEKKESGMKTAFLMGTAASSPCLLSWGALRLSLAGGYDYYRVHKIANGFFIQIFNFIEADASTKALSADEVRLMLPLAFVPAAIVIPVYILAFKGRIFSE